MVGFGSAACYAISAVFTLTGELNELKNLLSTRSCRRDGSIDVGGPFRTDQCRQSGRTASNDFAIGACVSSVAAARNRQGLQHNRRRAPLAVREGTRRHRGTLPSAGSSSILGNHRR